MKKVERALPMSPSKKKVVLLSMVNNLDENDRNELVNVISSKSNAKRSANCSELFEQIVEFYERDDVSRVSPKMSDVKMYTNKQTGVAELHPTRHVIMTLREAYALFIEDQQIKKQGNANKFILIVFISINYFFHDQFDINAIII